MIAAQMLRAEGAEEVVGVETSPWRREYALSHGIVDRAIDPLGEDGKALPLRNHPGAVDVSMDCAGARTAVQYMMDHTSDIVSLFAVQREPYTFEGWYVGLHQGLKVFGTPSRTPPAGEYAVRRVVNGSIDLSLTVTHTMPLGDYNRAMAMLRRQECLKVCFLPNG